MVCDPQLESRYHKIEQAWVKHPFHVAESDKSSHGPAQAAAEILKRHRLGEQELGDLQKRA